MTISRPLAIVDEDQCRRNIQKMAQKMHSHGLKYRPHFKTHQSNVIGQWFRDEGVEAILVSSAGMARYFADGGWTDITIGFPISPSQIEDVRDLAERINLKIFINDPEVAGFYAENLTDNRVDIFIEIDAGYGRSGVKHDQLEMIKQIIGKIEGLKNLQFYGFYVHDGRTYHVRGKPEVEKLMGPVFERLKALGKQFPDARICVGDTPSCSMLDSFPGVDEMSPGNSVFYDLMQVNIGSCTPEEIAMAVACPVAQVKPEIGEAILYGGAVHFSKDRINWQGREIFGRPTHHSSGSFGELVDDSYLKGLSQEHGILKGDPEWIASLKPGDTVVILPIHSCLTANLFDHYANLDGQRIEKRILS